MNEHEQRLPPPKALPVILCDTSAIISLAQNWYEYSSTALHERIPDAQSFSDVMNALMDGNRRTLVLTKSAFFEVFPNHQINGSGFRLPDPATHLRLTAPHYFKYPEVKYTHPLFDGFRKQNRLRYYDDVEQMLNAGELDTPKGGVVIVNNEPLRKSYYHPSASRNWLNDHADDCLIELTEDIVNHLRPQREQGLPSCFAMLNADKGIEERLKALYSHTIGPDHYDYPPTVWPIALVDALHYHGKDHPTAPQLSKNTVNAYYEARNQHAKNAGRNIHYRNDLFDADVMDCSHWLHHTQERPRTEQENPVLGTHTAAEADRNTPGKASERG
jgi:hypothetical protein